jgi:iron only hydrogenase large subunit-like protein
MKERAHTIAIDAAACVGCVDCCKGCPTKAIRVRDRLAVVDPELCIDCGACLRNCRYHAVRARTASPSDLKKFKHTVALPSQVLYSQFGKDVEPAQVLNALTTIGFDGTYDITWMCEMLAGAIDAHLSACTGPWPKISVTCPAIVRLIQLRYPDMVANLVPIETARELAAKLLRRKLSYELQLEPEEIGIFFITPCSAIVNSIHHPEGLKESYLDGAFSISELYGSIRQAIKDSEVPEAPASVSSRGLRWAAAGGEIAGMRNKNTMSVQGVHDVLSVFDRLEAGKFQAVDYIEAYICPDGCVGGQLNIEGRYAAQRNLQHILGRLGDQRHVDEEKVRSLLRERFFDTEEQFTARPIRPLGRDLREAVTRKKEGEAILARLPKTDCAACGAPDCATLAQDIVRGKATIEDCVFIKLARLRKDLATSKDATS